MCVLLYPLDVISAHSYVLYSAKVWQEILTNETYVHKNIDKQHLDESIVDFIDKALRAKNSVGKTLTNH